MTSKAALEALASQLGSGVRVQHWHEYYVIANMAAGNSRSVPIRCDYAGYPYACWYDENTAAVNTPRQTTDIENVDGADDLNQTNDSTEINYNGMTIVLPDGDFNIGEINYNSNNKSYNIEAYKYDITNNYYYTYNYSWTYHINYTSITYIGQSEEYDRSYNLYYQLPDGRSSADLTAEELEQLNLAVDVINYGRSADDTRLRSLYHFDGNTDDSSYWNYCTAFTWNQGASLTYLESGNFNGALYLDETDHDFTLTLPSSIGSNDFTLQFRYYQSATAAPQDDSYIRFGSTDLMRFNGSQILNGSGTVLSTMPIGTWNELAIIRESGTVRYYLNGVQLGTISNTTAFTAAVTFHFGSSQQTYKELDELRVLNYSLTSGGASYTPTSVPHDTNLALVLPDSVVPVADEYWDISFDDNVLSDYAFDWWDLNHPNSGFFNSSTVSFSQTDDGTRTSCYLNDQFSYAYLNPCCSSYSGIYQFYYKGFINTNYSSVSASDATSIVSNGSSGFSGVFYNQYYYGDNLTMPVVFPKSGFSIILPYDLRAASIFIVFDDGDNSIINIAERSRYSKTYSSALTQSTSSYGGYVVSLYSVIAPAISYAGPEIQYNVLNITPSVSGTGKPFVYLGFKYGSVGNYKAEKVSSVTLMDSSSLNTPTLAVRSDIPVTNYQIGGVRPSIPYKGLVWAMVESGYISSLQIYDGRAWVQCDGRIWTGERWIPYSSYNVVTLSDMYDIADASGQSGYEYIYSESGFWSWLQKFLLNFRNDLFSLLQGQSGGSSGSSGSEHQHVYTTEVLKEPTCTESGSMRYTCTGCDHSFTSATEPLGHDWVASEVVDDLYNFPEGVKCPNDPEHSFSYVLDKDAGVFHVTCSDCGETFDVDAEIEYGHTIYTCTRCGESYTESNKDRGGLFEVLGDFIADGIHWIADKLTQLVNAFSGISDIFSGFAETVRENAGEYPQFFQQVVAVMPDDLMNVLWFAIIGAVAVAAWRKWFG